MKFFIRRITMKLRLLAGIITTLILSGCGGGGGASGSSPTSSSSQSPPQASVPPTPVQQPPVPSASTPVSLFTGCNTNTTNIDKVYTFGTYRVSTGVWDPKGTTSYSSCINITSNSPGISATMNWAEVPSVNQTDAVYPNITSGWIPGLTNSNNNSLPALVSTVPKLNMTGTINTVCTSNTCLFDSVVDVFYTLVNNPSDNFPVQELVILTSYQNQPTTATIDYTVTIDGITFDVYILMPDGTQNFRWPVFVYMPKTAITNLNLNIGDFTADLSNRNYVAPSSYLTSISLGTQVITGTGYTTINNYVLN